MKFMMNERIKHRLTGIVVLVSIGVVFLPAMMKKSNQHFEENLSLSLKLPAKPIAPKVVIPQQTAMLKSVKVAHVELPPMPAAPHPAMIAKAESLSKNPSSVLVKVEVPLKSVLTAAVIPSKPVTHEKAIAAAVVNNMKEGYGIQLASFTQESNAEYLVARLRKQGYTASYNVIKNKKGQFYQVVAGMGSKKDEAVNLKKKIATNLQLNGFLIHTGVS